MAYSFQLENTRISPAGLWILMRLSQSVRSSMRRPSLSTAERAASGLTTRSSTTTTLARNPPSLCGVRTLVSGKLSRSPSFAHTHTLSMLTWQCRLDITTSQAALQIYTVWFCASFWLEIDQPTCSVMESSTPLTQSHAKQSKVKVFTKTGAVSSSSKRVCLLLHPRFLKLETERLSRRHRRN